MSRFRDLLTQARLPVRRASSSVADTAGAREVMIAARKRVSAEALRSLVSASKSAADGPRDRDGNSGAMHETSARQPRHAGLSKLNPAIGFDSPRDLAPFHG